MKNAQNIQFLVERYGQSMMNLGRHEERGSRICIDLHRSNADERMAAIKAALAAQKSEEAKDSLLDGKDRCLSACNHVAAVKVGSMVYLRMNRNVEDLTAENARHKTDNTLSTSTDIRALIRWLREVHLEAFGSEVQE